MMSKTKLVAIVLLALLVPFGTALAAPPVEITVFYSTSSLGFPRWAQAGIDRFNEMHTDIQAKLVTGNTNKLLTLIASGIAPDVIHGPGDRYIAQWAFKDIIQPIDKFVARDREVTRDLVPTIVPILSWKGQLYGLPRNWSAGGIICDTALFAERGVDLPDKDWTWEDLISKARKLTFDTTGDSIPDVYGFAGAFANAHRAPVWLWGAGGDVWNEDMSLCILDEPNSLTALRFYDRLLLSEGVSPLAYKDNTNQPTLMGQKRIGMVHGLAQLVGEAAVARADYQVYISPLPIGPGGADARSHIAVIDYISMYKFTPHPEEAWQVLKFMASEEGFNAGMDMTPTMGYQASLAPHLRKLRDIINNRSHEINPMAWIDIAYTMRGTTLTHPVLGDEVSSLFTSQMALVRDGKSSISNVAVELARQLNVRLNEVKNAGMVWWE
ncbi:MAG TPA: extracellular solute-binding protein [Firmicutes bacterium]|nr:extracellular solute-binding protein [Bacillota bacterium]